MGTAHPTIRNFRKVRVDAAKIDDILKKSSKELSDGNISNQKQQKDHNQVGPDGSYIVF